MADRSSDKGREDVSSTLGGASRLGAEGGETGNRASGAGRGGPSSQPVSEGLEGSILDDATEQQSQSRTGEGRGGSGGRSTGAGSEAAEGIHAAQGGRDQSQNSSVESAGTGMAGSGGRSSAAEDPTGSEPLHGRTREHQSGYGGFADRPKTSSDQREPLGDEEAGDGM